MTIFSKHFGGPSLLCPPGYAYAPPFTPRYAPGSMTISVVVECCGVEGKISDSDLSKISDSQLQLLKHKGNEIWLLKSMEIVLHSNKPLFQQKFQKHCTISTGIPILRV